MKKSSPRKKASVVAKTVASKKGFAKKSSTRKVSSVTSAAAKKKTHVKKKQPKRVAPADQAPRKSVPAAAEKQIMTPKTEERSHKSQLPPPAPPSPPSVESVDTMITLKDCAVDHPRSEDTAKHVRSKRKGKPNRTMKGASKKKKSRRAKFVQERAFYDLDDDIDFGVEEGDGFCDDELISLDEFDSILNQTRGKTANGRDPDEISDKAVLMERRCDEERRKDPSHASVPGKKVERRKKVPRRRQIDPTTCERDYSQEEVEFMTALDEYKRNSGRMFPTCSEILEVLLGLGYAKAPEPVVSVPEVHVAPEHIQEHTILNTYPEAVSEIIEPTSTALIRDSIIPVIMPTVVLPGFELYEGSVF